jgi:Fur family peroxide stress response transcriptional regulator
MIVPLGEIKERLKEAGLKVTPQRLAILDAIYRLENHPTADKIIACIRKKHPSIASGTVYKVLDTLVEKQLLKRVKTEKDVMRYDGILEQHHHLYCSDSDRIEDYADEELNRLLADYFEKKNIPGFSIEEIKLQINGKFVGNKNQMKTLNHKPNERKKY